MDLFRHEVGGCALTALQRGHSLVLWGLCRKCSLSLARLAASYSYVSIIVLCLFGMVVGLLTLPPHAILLSATGELFPSAFSRSLLPIITFAVSLFAVVFGMMSGRLNTLSDILDALSNGLSRSAPLVVIAILLIQFIASLGFVFN